jgi:hypothetical protein
VAILEQQRRTGEALGEAREQVGVVRRGVGQRGRLGAVGGQQPASGP